VVRNSWMTHPHRDAAGFWDASLWEQAKCKGRQVVHRMIDNALYNTSVTVVLIGAETYQREYVRYEILESYRWGKGMLGIFIHNIADRNQTADWKGANPFGELCDSGSGIHLSKLFPTYDWVRNNGYYNLGDWVDEAAQAAGR
jgi:hypothetical protein